MKTYISLTRSLVLAVILQLVTVLVAFILIRWGWPYIEGYARATAVRDFWHSIFGG